MIHRYREKGHIGFSVPCTLRKRERWDITNDRPEMRRLRIVVTFWFCRLLAYDAGRLWELRVRWGIT